MNYKKQIFRFAPFGWFQGYFLIYCSVLFSTIGYGISFPLLSISLESKGISGQLIGLNAAMPAIGWLVGSFFIPKMQFRFGLKAVLLSCLSIASVTILAFPHFESFLVWSVLRFLFGGSLGLFYRAIEYWINDIAENEQRGFKIGIYNFCFMLGIAIGSSLQPSLGYQDFIPFFGVFVFLIVSACFVFIKIRTLDESNGVEPDRFDWRLSLAIPMVMLAVFAYGLFEVIPTYFMSVYTLRNQLGSDVAAYTLTAAALGNLIFPLPLGRLSDRMDRQNLLLVCAFLVVVLSAIIPFTTANPILFLVLIGVWAGFAGSVYNVGLSIIGDKYQGKSLIYANASFGIFYALGSILGPILNGFAVDTLNSQGLMVSSAGMYGAIIVFALTRSVTRYLKS